MKKQNVFMLALLSILIDCFLLNTTYAQNETTNYTINENWKFSKTDAPNQSNVDFLDENWQKVTLPHTWNATDAVDETPGFYQGACWYRRSVYIGEEAKKKQVYIYFEGANQVVELYVNGVFVGKHIGGYTAFNFDITSFVNENSANLFSIKVNNSINPDIPPLSADYTFFGGIYRDVSLVFLSPIHLYKGDFGSSGMYITTPKVTEQEASIIIKGIVQNQYKNKKDITILQELIAPNGQIIVLSKSKLKVKGNSILPFETKTHTIKNPQLWSPEAPVLYTIRTTIIEDQSKQIQEITETPFGVRYFEFTADKGFFINGKPLKLIGTNRHECYEGMGNALTDEMHLRDIQMVKDMGGNFLRISHYPQDPNVLNLCDKLGIITMVEIPVINAITESDGFLNNSLYMTEEMVKQNFNHPSLVCWAYMNEVMLRPPFKKAPEKHITYCKEVNKQAVAIEKLLRNLDPNRYTLIPFHGSMTAYKEANLFEVPKIVGWNLYQGWYSDNLNGFDAFLDTFHKEYPSIPTIVTEYGADVDGRLHSFSPERFDYTVEYGNVFHEHYLNSILERDFISGATIWNLNDFYSEYRGGAVPHVNCKGITGLNRELKDTYLLYQANLLKKPFLAIGEKSWKTRSGIANDKKVCSQPLNIYSNQPVIDVYHNGISLGSFPIEKGMVTVNIPFIDGKNRIYVLGKNQLGLEDFYETDFNLIPSKSNDSDFKSINGMLGSKRYFEDRISQICWIPEQEYSPGSWGYLGGEPFRPKTKNGSLPASDLDILNTEQDPVFQTQRLGIKEFKADVSDGHYAIYMYWAHLIPSVQKEALAYALGNTSTYDNKGNYIFDVSINGQLFLKNFDIPTQIGTERAVIKQFQLTVKDGKGITIHFDTSIENMAYLNAIRIVKQ